MEIQFSLVFFLNFDSELTHYFVHFLRLANYFNLLNEKKTDALFFFKFCSLVLVHTAMFTGNFE